VIYRLSTYPRTHRVRRGACQAFEGGSSPLGGAIVKCLDRITFYQRKHLIYFSLTSRSRLAGCLDGTYNPVGLINLYGRVRFPGDRPFGLVGLYELAQ